MKKHILILSLIISACSSQDPAPAKTQTLSVKTDTAIQVFVDSFKGYADAHAVTMPVVVLQFGTCDCLKDNVWQVNSNADDLNLEFYVYHTLGHAVLKREESTGTSIMDQSTVTFWKGKQQQYMDELFGK